MAGLEESLRTTLGGKAAAKLDAAFGLTTTGDLLRHYPRRYAGRGELTDLTSLRDGDHVTVFAQVEKVRTRPMRARRGQLLEVTVTDGRARPRPVLKNSRPGARARTGAGYCPRGRPPRSGPRPILRGHGGPGGIAANHPRR